MDGAALRELQAPLKQQYRDDPEAARTPMHATASLSDSGITATVSTWSGLSAPGCTRRPVATRATPAPETCCCRRCWPAPG